MSLPESRLSGILTDRYEIIRELGQGGMATVYLARDLKHDREVALKVLRPELGLVLGSERFLTEIKITARLDHPHILTLIDSGAVDGLLYYVLPFVRGESLRDLLDREKQLGLEQALSIAKQVGSALDYAHRHGVVHRDIKPENILLQEGEAMLADFGIALAVKEAGGNRLTETGLSLGTPRYMSPEQATGDRALDARSDLYSLAAVLYEMLTGEPPLTGPTAQAVIAKLLTEQPTRIRIVRSTVPPEVDEAVNKALAKVPADRFASAGEFIAALGQTRSATMPIASAPARSKLKPMIIGGVVLAAAAVAAIFAFTRKSPEQLALSAPAALRDRTQLTFTGSITSPSLSSDGKQLAYFVQVCGNGSTPCAYAIEVQDVGNPTSRRVLEGLTAAYSLEWSPDRRYLLANGTIGGRYGTHLVSVVGAPPRYLTPGAATFYAGGDSLLIGPGGTDSAYTVKITSIAGVVADSIRVQGPGTSMAGLGSVPGSSLIVALVIQGTHGLWQVIDRSGKVTDRLLNSCTCGAVVSRDAIWMTRAGATATEAVVRVALDPTTGKLATRQDTIFTGQFTGLSVTADGAQMAVDEGSYAFTTTVASLPELLSGKAKDLSPLVQGSSRVDSRISGDGSRILLRRVVPRTDGTPEGRLSVMPSAGGPETAIGGVANSTAAAWLDSTTISASESTAKGTRWSTIDIRTGAVLSTLDVDSAVYAVAPLPNGWAYVDASSQKVVVQDGKDRREILKDGWFSNFTGIQASRDGARLAIRGWNKSTEDTLSLAVVPTKGGEPVRWFSSFAEQGWGDWLPDGSLLVAVWSTLESVSLFKVRGPGQVESLGTIPRPARLISVSDDLSRVSMMNREYHGDAWLYRVVTK